MEISLVKIGNSKGIRLPKSVIERYEFEDQLVLDLEKDCIVLRPKKKPREGWAESFRKMAENGDDQLLDSDLLQDDDIHEW
ncbi:AbrB/MazE/SpoVT family DNA-binding domain-containing protein [bacterium]|nr:MAG: AbrB/MazE/SpoVT family DNA-binding domain-containing protein [bacterium]